MHLEDEVKFVKGVGPNRAELLNKLEIRTLEDLITYYPREYEDRKKRFAQSAGPKRKTV